jgi:hypothetical protein
LIWRRHERFLSLGTPQALQPSGCKRMCLRDTARSIRQMRTRITCRGQPARRAKSSEAPNPHMTAPEACRTLVMKRGRLASPALAAAAQ